MLTVKLELKIMISLTFFRSAYREKGGIVGTNNTSGINDRCRNCFGSSALFSNVD